uniref:Uncharacterized protein n=1 Tax=Arion vulgaris TaxID=1028688 RepID=A0A0B7BRT3_9EUPU
MHMVCPKAKNNDLSLPELDSRDSSTEKLSVLRKLTGVSSGHSPIVNDILQPSSSRYFSGSSSRQNSLQN